MAEYIQRETLLERAEYDNNYRLIIPAEALKAAPAANVVPVVHGEWVRPHWRNSNFCYDCSVCGNEVMHQEYRWRDKKIYPICPWCGAKMDGGVDNETD